MTYQKKRREPPYSLRLTEKERAWLRDRAGNICLGTYIKSVLFSDASPAPRRRRSASAPVKDAKALADVLACLGASRIGSNLNQLAKATHIGSFHFDEETKRQLVRACEDVRVMRQLLMQALGQRGPQEPKANETVSQTFARVSHTKRYTL